MLEERPKRLYIPLTPKGLFSRAYLRAYVYIRMNVRKEVLESHSRLLDTDCNVFVKELLTKCGRVVPICAPWVVPHQIVAHCTPTPRLRFSRPWSHDGSYPDDRGLPRRPKIFHKIQRFNSSAQLVKTLIGCWSSSMRVLIRKRCSFGPLAHPSAT